jgi:NADP-reducing hydrogenase subunit HndC
MNLKYLYVWESDKKKNLYNTLVKKITSKNLDDKVKVLSTKYIGITGKKSIIKIMPENITYTNFNETEDIDKIIDSHFINNKVLDEFIYITDNKFAKVKEKDKYYKQLRIVLRNSGYIDPENINDYLARDGYKALEKALFKMTPTDVIEEIKKSGLRGRGGAGFPTGKKWEITKNVQSDIKYVVCNADEGDPGAYMDRSVLEGDPYSVIEGMTICAYAVGAQYGYIYVRAEYPLAIKRLQMAIDKANEMGLLGNNILNTKFSFNIEIRLGAGAFVCGEETALIASIEGKRGMPRPRPPFPAISGLWGKPTVINNVETWANIPVIIIKGSQWFSSIGTETSKGTKVFALTGKIKYPGLIEVPMGTTIREIVFDIGGGILNNKKIKAVQTGGPSGGVIPEEYLDLPIDYESLQKIGSMMGSGGMIVMDEDDCMIDVAKFYLQFTVDESCGKCAPCRIGGKQLLEILKAISSGKAEEDDITRLKRISFAMKNASLCGLGQSAPNPVISTLKYFEHEYIEHIRDKKCKTGKCKDLITYTINQEKCIGCGACALRCPAGAISGEKRKPHNIDQLKCIKCGECYLTCKFNAINKL